MRTNEKLLSGYENMRLKKYEEITIDTPGVVAYDDLPELSVKGVLKSNFHINGKLCQTYSADDNHVCVIAGTRLGKTTGYVVPLVCSFAHQKVKKSMIISDPKGEVYRLTAETLRKEGYKVLLLNFRDYNHSECWNPLMPICEKYCSQNDIYGEIELVEVNGKPCNKFRGRVYESQQALDRALALVREQIIMDVTKEIDDIAMYMVPPDGSNDPYWADSAREVFKGFMWAMLEDVEAGRLKKEDVAMSTIFDTLRTFHESENRTYGSYDDNGYFSKRGASSRALELVTQPLLENAPRTRSCVMSMFNTKISTFRAATANVITSFNSFDFSEFLDGNVALFIDYQDEIKTQYELIGRFVQDLYKYFIQAANERPRGKFENPIYFILDEFGNFPAFPGFETTISACAGRNIFFVLIVQSYAQLDAVYSPAVAKIIRDNLNVQIFMGSNNRETLEEFARMCGQRTRLSPLSAINGRYGELENRQLETIPLIPVSELAHFEPGECVVTEANSGYVLYSKLERYYTCDEFKDLPQSNASEYRPVVDAFERIFSAKRATAKRR